jgi:hypothetical protein
MRSKKVNRIISPYLPFKLQPYQGVGMKSKGSIVWCITRLLGLSAVSAFLWALAACQQPSGTAWQDPPEMEENAAEEEEQQQQEKQQEQQQDLRTNMTGILIGSPPETLYYALGQSFDPSGLIVEGEYDDDTSRILEAGEYTLSPVDTAVSGPLRVTVSAGPHTASFPIMVNNSASVLQSISVSVPAGGLVRYLGQILGTEGFTVTGNYTEGARPLPAFSVRNYDRTARGLQTVTLSVNGKTATLPVTVRVPADATVQADIRGIKDGPNTVTDVNIVFIKGQSLSMAVNRFRAAVTCNNVTAVLFSGDGIDVNTDIGGFEPGQPGKQTLTLTLDEKSVPVEIYAADIEPQAYFDYGFMRHAGDPDGWGAGSGRTEGSYHTSPGAALVLSPVRVLIGYNTDSTDLGVSYAWTVTPLEGSPALSPSASNGEFLSITPQAAGSWQVSVTVTGRNFVDGSAISKTAHTKVICDAGSLTPGTFPLTTKNFSPGQFTESGTGAGWSLGAFGGYVIKKVEHKAQYTIMGNAFTGWEEPGVVWVQEDNNHNGLPDEIWYELNTGSFSDTTRRYSLSYFKSGDDSTVNEYGQAIKEIYWVDGKGRTGQISAGWPWKYGVSNADGAWAAYTGTLLDDNGKIKDSSIYFYNRWSNCVDTGQSVFPVSDAIAADGSAAGLNNVSFVKVHTGAFRYGNAVGELSTEIVGINESW